VPWSSSFERGRSFRGNAGKYARCIGCHSAKLQCILLRVAVCDNTSAMHFARNLRDVERVSDAQTHVSTRSVAVSCAIVVIALVDKCPSFS
jgi:hypothetical protein